MVYYHGIFNLHMCMEFEVAVVSLSSWVDLSMYSIRKYQYLNLINKEFIFKNQHRSIFPRRMCWNKPNNKLLFHQRITNQTTLDPGFVSRQSLYKYAAMLVIKRPAGVTSAEYKPEETIACRQRGIHARDPPCFWNPRQTLPEVRNKGISGPTKRTYFFRN